MSRVVLGRVTAALVIVSALGVLHMAATGYLSRQEASSNRLVEVEQLRRRDYRRAVIFTAPVEQNAADWYRPVFANLNALPRDTVTKLQPQTDRGSTIVPLSSRLAFADRCHEMDRTRIVEAFRSTRCDWRLGDRLDASTTLDYFPAAAILTNCKLLEGDRRADQHDWQAAARSYLEIAAFGSDLDQGMFGMNVAGLASTKLALEALGRLVGSIDDKDSLHTIRTEVAKLDGHLPTLRSGLRLIRIWVGNSLIDEAKAYVATHEAGLGRILPWSIPAAWRFAQSASLLRLLDRAIEVGDPAARRQIAHAIDAHPARSPRMVVNAELPAQWDELVGDASRLTRQLASVQLGIQLQEWYLGHGAYPDDLTPLQWRDATNRMRYTRSPDGQGYTVFDEGSATPFLTRPTAMLRRSKAQ